jgi:hypothetical protein
MNLKKYIIIKILGLFIVAGIFSACKKENDYSSNKKMINKNIQQKYLEDIYAINVDEISDGAEYYEKHLERVQAISELTGVDIMELSQTEFIVEFEQTLDFHLSTITNSVESGELTQGMLEDIKQRTQNAEEAGDECAILHSLSEIGKIMYSESTLDMENHCREDLPLPVTNLNDFSNSITVLYSNIGSLYSSFNDLSSDMQKLVLAEAYNHYEIEKKLEVNGGDPMCFGPLEDERDRRIRNARIALAFATGAWWLSAAGGTLTALVGTASFVVACIQYEETVDDAWRLYWYQGGTESR